MQHNLKSIGLKTDDRCYVIAEIGINHGGSMRQAVDLVESAAKTGCHAVKFQTYNAEQRVPVKKDPLHDILKRCELDLSSFRELKELSEHLGLDFFSTAFDKESLAYLIKIGVEIFKIASFDVTNGDLLKATAETKKTLLMSVGMASAKEICDSYQLIKSLRIKLLSCIVCLLILST